MKRTISLLLCVLLLIPAFALVASAVVPGDTYMLDAVSDFDLLGCDEPIPDGVYHLSVYAFGQPFATVGNIEIRYDYFDGFGRYSYIECRVSDTEVVPFRLYSDGSGYESFPGCKTILLPEANVPIRDAGFTAKLVYSGPLPSPGRMKFVESISNTLHTVIEWVGNVTSALISGELNGLLLLAAIPIAITVMMLSIKFIRKNSWGC